ncbi:four helix bundle protein [Aequorivita vladivostokensis]|jgi:four helix bundle protein|uniref:four helix bundle protein n=1 Tax=Aequorivita vladivostokensis TaxID=171194 RepID=UPI000B176314|nr:four helix bundle protein [Aequorivita vladivostokensis]MDX1783055.1 four helix bundle protein [Aequorivita vladivostokensis]|tara:strand:- start:666 stop:1028 length:363 start_codon:yes stop_codon:yes gene_type:complete
MKIFGFEKLQGWQRSRQVSIKIYKATADFTSEEKFGLTSQMRRAAISISSNIAEGTGRHTNKDKGRFTEIAYGSALELLNQCILSNDLEFLNEEKYLELRNDITEITAMLDGLYKSQIPN